MAGWRYPPDVAWWRYPPRVAGWRYLRDGSGALSARRDRVALRDVDLELSRIEHRPIVVACCPPEQRADVALDAAAVRGLAVDVHLDRLIEIDHIRRQQQREAGDATRLRVEVFPWRVTSMRPKRRRRLNSCMRRL